MPLKNFYLKINVSSTFCQAEYSSAKVDMVHCINVYDKTYFNDTSVIMRIGVHQGMSWAYITKRRQDKRA